MNALTLSEPGRVTYREVDPPQLVDPTDAIIRVRASAICGSDLHVYNGRITGIESHEPIGHEFVGVVEAVGPQVRRFKPGDRATGAFFSVCGSCWACTRRLYSQCTTAALFGFGPKFGSLAGTQAEWVRVPHADTTLIAVPDEVPDEAGITVGDILSTAYFAVMRSDVKPGDIVAVIGLGPVGLLAVELAYVFGAARVIALDIVQERLEKAEGLGATSLYAKDGADRAVRQLTGGRGADAVIEAVGSEPTLALALRIVRGFGTVSSAGVYTESSLGVAMGRVFAKDLTVRAGMCNVPAVADAVMTLVQNGRLHPENLFSHRLPLSEGPQGYKMFAQRQALKILLVPDGV